MRTELLETLSKDSESLVKLAMDFRNQTSHIKIVSFIEQSTTPPLKTRVSRHERIFERLLTDERRLSTIIVGF